MESAKDKENSDVLTQQLEKLRQQLSAEKLLKIQVDARSCTISTIISDFDDYKIYL